MPQEVIRKIVCGCARAAVKKLEKSSPCGPNAVQPEPAKGRKVKLTRMNSGN